MIVNNDTKVGSYRRFAMLDAWYERIVLKYFGQQPLVGQQLEDLAERWALRHYGTYGGFDRNPVMEQYRRVFVETYKNDEGKYR